MRLVDVKLDEESGVLHVHNVALNTRVRGGKQYSHGEVHKHSLWEQEWQMLKLPGCREVL